MDAKFHSCHLTLSRKSATPPQNSCKPPFEVKLRSQIGQFTAKEKQDWDHKTKLSPHHWNSLWQELRKKTVSYTQGEFRPEHVTLTIFFFCANSIFSHARRRTWLTFCSLRRHELGLCKSDVLFVRTRLATTRHEWYFSSGWSSRLRQTHSLIKHRVGRFF